MSTTPEWIPARELEAIGVASATIYRRTKSGAWQFRRTRKSVASIGTPLQKEILVSSLPAHIVRRITAPSPSAKGAIVKLLVRMPWNDLGPIAGFGDLSGPLSKPS